MTQNQSNSDGLDLFDEKASAVRGFPNAMLGYDKKVVDDYVRDLEQQLSRAKHQYREVQKELTAANLRSDDTDFSKLGGHTASLLRVAESQANDLVVKAQNEADRLVSQARDEAERTRSEALQETDHARRSGIDELKSLRLELQDQTTAELEAARVEAQGLREAVDKHRAMVIADAQQQANAMIEAARAEAAHIVQKAEHEAAQLTDRVTRETNALRADTAQAVQEARAAADAEVVELRNMVNAEVAALRNQTKADVAETRARLADEVAAVRDRANADANQIRAEVAAERDESLAALEVQQRELRDQLAGMVTDARRQSDDLQEKLAAASEELRRRQQSVYAEAERIKADSINEAAAIVAQARHNADEHWQRTEGELLRRTEQLKREQNLLRQRKEALVAQLNNLSSLANLTALEFPEEESNTDLAELIEEPSEGKGTVDEVEIVDSTDNSPDVSESRLG
ncbi:DivIVA domain-containing protein [Nigerium massiliense]|uniref:DivIVA domain-containing protein n=1 Tax=Nigerium massiliense TaxID=1522317 RepID=UPI00058BAC2F|nr:DivIVA domain-containing protein [Nigerium massiliense]